ncbi:MAG: K(+)-transporting ATPase subunit C [Opitutaceae bacterium]|nr:K(+)-transporting ATPase subunit C [Opitutaceae bacterium]
MKTFLSALATSSLLTLVMAVLLCALYPLTVWAGAQALFPHKANGSLIVDADGTIRGSELIAQPFPSDRYFHPRPSAAGAGYDATASSGSNLGPTSRKLADLIAVNVSAYRSRNGLTAMTPVPADAVTASGSGLDPEISVVNADLQTARVAMARGLPIDTVRALVMEHTKARDLGVLGASRVNVVQLNRTLDGLARTHPGIHGHETP